MRGFISYSHDEAALFKRLKNHLSFVAEVSFWTDQQILAGDKWDDKILLEMSRSELILLCISASFWASNYIRTKEYEHAKQRHEKGTATIVPVIMRDCLWQADKFLASLSAVPLYGKPIQTWTPQDNGLADACKRIDALVKKTTARTTP